MNSSKQKFLDECIARYVDVKGIYGTIPTQIFVHAFNLYYPLHKAAERCAKVFVDNLLCSQYVSYGNGGWVQYSEIEDKPGVWQVYGLFGEIRRPINCNRPLKSNIIPLPE